MPGPDPKTPGIKTSELKATFGVAGGVAALPILLKLVPPDDVWIAIVAGCALAAVYVSWRGLLKLLEMRRRAGA